VGTKTIQRQEASEELVGVWGGIIKPRPHIKHPEAISRRRLAHILRRHRVPG